MRSVYILFLLFLDGQASLGQLSRLDSGFVAQYGNGPIAFNEHKVGVALSASPYYLIKFKRGIDDEIRHSYKIVRQLSAEHAIIFSDRPNESANYADVAFVTPANSLWKLPPSGQIVTELGKFQSTKWLVVASTNSDLLLLLRSIDAHIIRMDTASNTFLIELRKYSDANFLITAASVKFLQPYSTAPHEELLINGLDLSTNRINLLHHKYPSINGSGLVASVNENRFDSSDIDFKGRYVSTGASSSTLTSHATIMATMLAGGGNSYYLGEGVAWNAKLVSTDFSTLLPQSNNFYQQFHIGVENHSYGTAIENFYGADAAAYDASVRNNPSLVHVFSAGNSGTAASTTGTYVGLNDFANLTGSFKMAKNIITVGSTDSFNNVELLSSRGPAYDGRVKPDLVAFGQDGSSGAAALGSGSAITVQHAYQSQHHDTLPPASLVKAALINSADEIGTVGPDYVSGFGALNANNAVASILEGRFFLNTVLDKGTQKFLIDVPAGIEGLKVTLAYSDLPAQANAFKALVNDLDLEVKNTSTGQAWKSWVLNTAPNKDSLLLPAVRGRDSLNNVEQVAVTLPTAGVYELSVYGYRVTNATQDFSVVYQLDTLNHYEWDFPRRNDPIIAHGVTTLRWHQSFGGNGILESSTDKGNSWQLISSNVNLSRRYFQWNTPDTFSTALLRMTINGQQFISDTFVISQTIELHVGFNCEDSVLLNWNSVPPADQYQLYALTADFLQAVRKTSDTNFLFAKNDFNTKFFSVAPQLKGREGIKAFTINYETQGVGCYLKSFLAQLVSNNALVTIALGTLYQVKQIDIEKDNGASFISVQTFDHPTQLNFQSQLGNLHQGINRFRIRITLQNGKVVYSEEELIFFTGTNNFIVYPNPVQLGRSFFVLHNNVDDATLVLYDSYGRKMQQVSLQDIVNPVNTSLLQRGIYFILVIDSNRQHIFQQKIIVQ